MLDSGFSRSSGVQVLAAHPEFWCLYGNETMRRPRDAPVHPSDGPEHPNNGPEHPWDGKVHPGDGPEHLRDGPEHPSNGPEHPNNGPEHLHDGPEHPWDGKVHPGDGPEHPGGKMMLRVNGIGYSKDETMFSGNESLPVEVVYGRPNLVPP